MSWLPKEQPSSFDSAEISGMYFLDGDFLARALMVEWTKDQKYPLIQFPSGLPFDLWDSLDPNNPTVHLFGEMDLAYRDTRDTAYTQAMDIAEQVGYAVYKVGNNRLELWGDDDGLLVTYDNEAGHMTNVEKIPGDQSLVRLPLLDEESRNRLPKLYSQEKLGMNATAQVKFFTPDAQWIWYASEFDGEDTFFGLVVGDEIELGYFSLAELQSVRGGMGLPVERDRYFTPTTLKEMRAYHQQSRYG